MYDETDNTYHLVAATGALNEAQAKKLAKQQHRIYTNGRWEGPGLGICYQGSYGEEYYLTWAELNAEESQ